MVGWVYNQPIREVSGDPREFGPLIVIVCNHLILGDVRANFSFLTDTIDQGC